MADKRSTATWLVPAALGVAAVAGSALSLRRWARNDEGPWPTSLADGAESTVETDDGARLALTVAGRPDGEKVLLVHCWTGSRRTWFGVAEKLIADGFQVATYDQRGHGASTWGRDELTVERLGDDVASVLAHLDWTDVRLAGHSMGGMSAMAYCVGHTDDAHARLRSLTLVATAAGGLSMGARNDAFVGRVVGLRAADRLLRSRHTGPFVVRGAVGDRPSLATLLDTARLFADCPADVRSACIAGLFRMDLLEGLRSLHLPTTILVGARDTLTPPEHARAMAATIPGAHLEVLDGLGHMLPYEATAQVAKAISG